MVFTQVSFSATLDSKGRVTVPARIRDKLELEKGGRLSITVETVKVLTREVEDFQEALQFIQELGSVKSFSFSDGKVEVVLCE
ncbi:MAG: AbrB/MazE/SpoVT family DNA-binding domain-containing protein [Candidatus Nanohaloarchaea archaeon]